jgi:hypothetical protein
VGEVNGGGRGREVRGVGTGGKEVSRGKAADRAGLGWDGSLETRWRDRRGVGQTDARLV